MHLQFWPAHFWYSHAKASTFYGGLRANYLGFKTELNWSHRQHNGFHFFQSHLLGIFGLLFQSWSNFAAWGRSISSSSGTMSETVGLPILCCIPKSCWPLDSLMFLNCGQFWTSQSAAEQGSPAAYFASQCCRSVSSFSPRASALRNLALKDSCTDGCCNHCSILASW